MDKCAVCSKVFHKSDKVCQTKCNHRFHYNCLQFYVKRDKACPECHERVIETDIKLYFDEPIITYPGEKSEEQADVVGKRQHEPPEVLNAERSKRQNDHNEFQRGNSQVTVSTGAERADSFPNAESRKARAHTGHNKSGTLIVCDMDNAGAIQTDVKEMLSFDEPIITHTEEKSGEYFDDFSKSQKGIHEVLNAGKSKRQNDHNEFQTGNSQVTVLTGAERADSFPNAESRKARAHTGHNKSGTLIVCDTDNAGAIQTDVKEMLSFDEPIITYTEEKSEEHSDDFAKRQKEIHDVLNAGKSERQNDHFEFQTGNSQVTVLTGADRRVDSPNAESWKAKALTGIYNESGTVIVCDTYQPRTINYFGWGNSSKQSTPALASSSAPALEPQGLSWIQKAVKFIGFNTNDNNNDKK